jgi:uncharacterized protein YqgC (DUF456 family)
VEYVYAVLLFVVVAIAWGATLLGIPGNWLIALATGVYVLLIPADSPFVIGWTAVAALVLLAAMGEVVEFVAGALGVAREGGSKRGAALALAGSIVGGIVGLFVGLPIPVLGPVLAALLFASLGALAGAVAGERWRGRTWTDSWSIGKAAFRGRLVGTLAKAAVGLVMIAVVAVALLR